MSRLALHRPGERGKLAAAHPELLLADPVLVLEEAAGRRAGGAGAVLVVGPAVTRAHEQARLGEPPHRTAEVRAVDREDLELLALDAAHPARDLRGRPVPLHADWVLEDCQPGLPLGEARQGTQPDP